jgi:hypothetical protein
MMLLFLSTIHGFARILAVSFTLTTCRSMLARERPAVGPVPDTGTLRTITAFFARCAIVGLGGPLRYEEQPLPFGRLARRWSV